MSSENRDTAETATARLERQQEQDEEEPARLPELCPIANTLHLMHEKWTLHIVYVLLSGKKRFNEIGHAMGGVNARTLRERLRGLESAGIVERQVISAMPPWVEYELTEKGQALSDVMDAMRRWSHRWQDAPPYSSLPADPSAAALFQRGGGDTGTESLDG